MGLPDPLGSAGRLEEVEGVVWEAPGISGFRADPGQPARLAQPRAALGRSASSEDGAKGGDPVLCF